MYVCTEVTLRGDAHGIGRSTWGQGMVQSVLWIQCPNPAASLIPHHARSLYSRTWRFLNQLYSRQLRVNHILMNRGAALTSLGLGYVQLASTGLGCVQIRGVGAF